MIYFAQSVDGGPVKIGYSAAVDTRIRHLEAFYGRPLALLTTMEGDRETEREIHKRFAGVRLGRTEQFQPTAELMAFIGRPLLVGVNPQAVELMEQPKTILIRGTGEWAAWLEGGAEFCRLDVAKLIDLAVVAYLKKEGYGVPPPKRVP